MVMTSGYLIRYIYEALCGDSYLSKAFSENVYKFQLFFFLNSLSDGDMGNLKLVVFHVSHFLLNFSLIYCELKSGMMLECNSHLAHTLLKWLYSIG